VASSSDGAKLVAAAGDLLNIDYVYTSVDSGATWTQTGTAQAWTSVASSADGTKLVAASEGGGIYTSVDSGATWTQTGTAQAWTSVASSADGTKLVAGFTLPTRTSSGYLPAGGYLCTSADSGAAWTQTGPDVGWMSVASSADGSKLVAAGAGAFTDPDGISGYSDDYLYMSTDSGVTWNQTAIQDGWRAVASSADGTKLVAAVYFGYIYTGSRPAP